MNILILDDEKHARDAVRSLLASYYKLPYEVLEASNIEEALQLIENQEIALAFLDVKLKGATTFDFLIRLPVINFKIVFISGHDEYAIRAFRFNAIDYLLKPIYPLEFQEALEKIDSSTPLSAMQLTKLNKDVHAEKIENIVLKDMTSVHILPVSDLYYCKSDGNYTTFFLEDNSSITIAKPIKEYEKLLRGTHFFRTHRSYLVNLNHIRSFDKKDDGFIVMKNKSEVPLARNKKDSFMLAMKVI
ncbi:MAG: LytTR family DNA-binding domain-containing protein [Bacteroidota bacterium]